MGCHHQHLEVQEVWSVTQAPCQEDSAISKNTELQLVGMETEFSKKIVYSSVFPCTSTGLGQDIFLCITKMCTINTVINPS